MRPVDRICSRSASGPPGTAAIGSLLLSTLLLAGCPPDPLPTRALYEWRSTVAIPDSALRAFDSLEVDRLYVRFFDVQWSAGTAEALPRSTARFATRLPADLEIVPTIYITNETMRRVSAERLGELAERIVEKVERMVRELGGDGGRYRELQIDCDWTASTRTSYFALLRSIDDLLPESVTLSATIRLHQVRYRRDTGTPPADRGLLMVYNTGEVTEPAEENSIITESVVASYIDRLEDYPLPLDVALPIFSWGVRFHFGRFASIIPEVTAAELADRREFRQIATNRFVARRQTELRGERLEPGDVIRTEEARPEEVLPVAGAIARELRSEPRTIVLYRYDPLIFARHETNRLLPLYRAFE